jgi:two-component system CheB/CheR fusion protein
MTAQEPTATTPSYYVGIGASAGGLEAIEQFFQGLPLNTGMAFIVIQHLSPDYKSLMVELLSKKTDIPVLRAEEGMIVEKDSIYLIPPKKNLTIFHGKLLLSDQPPHDRWINLPIDIFFRSLAEDQKEKAIGVILSGTGSDGMPKSAMSTGTADFILKAEEMSDKLLAFVKYPHLTKVEGGERLVQSDDGLSIIFFMLRSKTKVDFTYYKPSTVLRRIERRMNVNQLDNLRSYIDLLKSSNRELSTLYRELLIGVTNFFRDREAFDHLSENVLPELIRHKKNDPIRVWVAGCSTGEEAYSLAILLRDVLEKNNFTNNVKIFATDVDSDAVITAGTGTYPESIAADVGPFLLSKHFHRQGDNYHISRKIREMVVFAQHNIIADPPFTNIDLISCRNLLIYLQPTLQKKALEMFNFSLNPNGILFLGTSETTGEMSSFFEPKHHKWKIYESRGKRTFFHDKSDGSVPFTPRNHLSRLQTTRSLNRRPEGDPNRQLYDRLFKALSEDIIPLTVVVNEDMEVIYTIGNTGKYFRLPHGKMENDITKMVQQEIAIPLTIGIKKAIKESREITYSNIRFHSDSLSCTIQISIRPLPVSKNQEPLFAILMTEVNGENKNNNDNGSKTYEYDKEIEQRIIDLEQELQFTKENLQATIEELETSNEELQATNEELLASNEELQSTNEELQSVNEELYTVNSEHQRKIMELTELNNDIDNLLTSTEIGTVFLDEQLQVRKFTSPTQQVFNIIESDIGRPFDHLTHHLVGVDMLELVQHVVTTARPFDQKVHTTDGRWFFMRILPYHIAPQTFAGVVITLIEVTDLVHTERALEESEARLQLAEQVVEFASWQWNVATGTMIFARSLERLLGYEPHRLGRTFEALLQCIHPDDRQSVIETVSAAVEKGSDYEVTHRICRPDGSERMVKQVGVASLGVTGKAVRMTGITVDISEDPACGSGATRNNLILHNNEELDQEGLVVIDEHGIIRSVNQGMEALFGYKAEELIGHNVSRLMPAPHRDHHDVYISRYLETGESKVIGIGRQVEVLGKNGELIPAHLSIGEIKIGAGSLFTGVLRPTP